MFEGIKKCFNQVKKAVAAVAVAAVAAVATVPDVHAAMSAADETAIKSGLTSSDTIFYSIGGAILIVMAGIWGFKKVQMLLQRG